MSFEFNPEAKIKKISRSWERLKEWREDNIEVEDLDKIVNPILDGGRAAVCDFIKNNPLPIIENPINAGLERFWSDVARCDLDDEDRPRPENNQGVSEFCVAFSGGKSEGREIDSVSMTITYIILNQDDGTEETITESVTRSWTSTAFTPLESVCFDITSGSPSFLGFQATARDFSGSLNETDIGGFWFSTSRKREVSVFQRLPEEERISDPSDVVTVLSYTEPQINYAEEGDDEGEEEGDDPPPLWEKDDEDPPETDVDINIDIPRPPNYPDDFPHPSNINIRFDSDNRRIEGDKFVVNFNQEGADLVFDAFDPPEFLDTALDIIGDAADIASDILPAPFDTIPRLVSDVLDDEEEEEEPIEIDVDRKSCEQGELKITTETIAVFPSQERVVREIIESQNRIEEVRCSVGAFQAVRVEITEFPVRGKARFGDSPEQSRFFFGWIQFTREGEMFGAPQILEFNPQTFPFPLEADDFLIQFIDGAEGETEVIELEENGGE